ncbi:NAD(P)-dependent dehydrogenase (short-subunit alcohol dehydrogenase family) [Trinickia symbiotica]|uniref:Short chain dehydrogenase n=1 Tax=Trinickia symbiotica TaxID=863227 RepID=A0A2N7WV04_9BURK|nr:oxidoreductase [Trinickia symbiotica]PMS33230.1 short chain dehydrogenase [Trinickia symbiotica]PPK42247.1 NAD(P)-dependent dehydrogenase (short-subunit alcohol dehydrogenase family) [Trinickia symbiotica]
MYIASRWTVADIADQTGKRVLITGANSGIGFYAALELARKGAEVILACRDTTRGETALAAIAKQAPGTRSEVAIVDLASLASVREFTRTQLARQRPIHILINNAGVMAPPRRRETVDGFELQFGTNVLGHFLLTELLMPALEQAAGDSAERPRILTIASIAHKRGRLDFDDLQSTRSYSPMRAYQQSKLADLMLAFELDRRLRAKGSRVMSVAAHPGVAETNLFRNGDYNAVERALRVLVGKVIAAALNSGYAGALPTLYAATSPDVREGGYYGPQGLFEARGSRVGEADVATHARDVEAGRRLWEVCETLTGAR